MAVLSTHEKRKVRIRNRLKRENKAKKPFLTVVRSNQHISAQLIDAATGHVLVSASTQEKDVREKLARGANKNAAETIGRLVAERCQQKKIADVVFDRSGYLYHGRVAALADAARAGGLKF